MRLLTICPLPECESDAGFHGRGRAAVYTQVAGSIAHNHHTEKRHQALPGQRCVSPPHASFSPTPAPLQHVPISQAYARRSPVPPCHLHAHSRVLTHACTLAGRYSKRGASAWWLQVPRPQRRTHTHRRTRTRTHRSPEPAHVVCPPSSHLAACSHTCPLPHTDPCMHAGRLIR